MPLLLLAALLSAAPARAGSEQPMYALVVANNAPLEPGQAPLRFADDDGAAYYELLAPAAREAVLLSVLDADTQARHPGLAARTRPPTRAELARALARLNQRMDQDRARGEAPVLFFVYTGHGKRGAAGEGAVALLDGPFTRTNLYQDVLAPSRASLLHLVVDACDSYFLVNARGGLPVAPPRADAVVRALGGRELARYPHVGAILSTSSAQESHEWSDIRSGVFSHQVRSALSGAADVNGDGRVEYSELRAFVAAANQGVDDVRGRLDIWAEPPALDRAAPLSDLSRRASLGYLLLPEALAGRLWVEDARGVRRAELNKEAGRPLVLALPAERSGAFYLRSPGREARFTLPAPGALVDAGALGWSEQQLAGRGAVQDAFRERLFATPFGPTFYGGYVAAEGEAPVAAYAGPDLSP